MADQFTKRVIINHINSFTQDVLSFVALELELAMSFPFDPVISTLFSA